MRGSPTYPSGMTFAGFPLDAADFYAELEQDNSREFWAAHRERYERVVRGPMIALLAELEEEFGPGHVFRPHRNLRFSADPTPYKTHQGGFVQVGPRTGWYAEVSADGFRVAGGTYHLEREALAAFRQAVDAPGGARLEQVVAGLVDRGWAIEGSRLRTAPRGWPRDHERIALLRHTALSATRWIHEADVVTTRALLDQVRDDWREVRPLVEWLRPVVPDPG